MNIHPALPFALTTLRAVDDGAADAAAVTALPSTAADLVQAVDFPDFVANLIEGTFAATVKGSIEQMRAYGSLYANATEAPRHDASTSALVDPDD